MRPVIFLDMDGVLVTFASQAAGEKRRRILHGRSADDTHDQVIDPELVANLDRVCRESGAEIVVSSSWRKSRHFVHLPGQLARLGLTAEVIGRTPIYPVNGIPRGHEIADWLRANPRERYVVLDDETDAGLGHDGRFVQCSMSDGLTEERAAAALAMLLS